MAQLPAPPSAQYNPATISWINVIVGIWLIVSPVVLGFVGSLPSATWNTFIAGALVVIFACGRLAKSETIVALSWLNLLVGLWLIGSPFLLEYAAFARPLWNSVSAGLIVTFVSLASAEPMPATRSLPPLP
jgi:hypothetical protein